LVVDASVAVKWLIRETESDAARSLLALEPVLSAPDILPVEFAGALTKKHRRRQLPAEEVRDALRDLSAVDLTFVAAATLLDDAVEISLHGRHPLADCLYLAMARRTGVRLATFDGKLAALATRLGIPLWTPA
jgi:predicted nucleic acid-binding protein